MHTCDTLKQLRRDSELSQIQVAEFMTAHGCEVTQRAVSKWERGDTQPNAEQFMLLCELYQVRDVLETFRGKVGLLGALNPQGRQRALEYIRLLEGSIAFAKESRVRPQKRARMIPLYDMPASAGTGQFLDNTAYELIEADETVPESATFAVRLSGDSMTPRFVDGQVVYVRQQQTLKPGEYGIFILNGNAYCKLFSDANVPELISLNGKYGPIKIKGEDDFRVLGKVVG